MTVTSHHPASHFRLVISHLLSLIVVIMAAASAPAQESTPLALKPGVPNGSYALSDIDSINLFAGRVNVHLPLIAQMGRGQSSGTLSFTIDSPAPWIVKAYYYTDSQVPFYVAEPGFSSDGIHTGEYYGIRGESTGGLGHQCYSGLTEEYWAFNSTVTRLFLIDPDGTEHEMRDVQTNGAPLNSTSYCYLLGNPPQGPSRGTKFVSVDGSGATAIFDSSVKDGTRADSPYPVMPSGWLLLKDGRRMRLSGDVGMRDRNGNIFLPGKDSLNRTIGGEFAADANCPGYSGQSMTCEAYSHKGFPNGTERKIWISKISSTEKRLYLPNGLYYKFTYNSYGDLARLDLPTGGSIEYDYGPGLEGPQPGCGTDFPPGYPQGCMPGTYGFAGSEGYHVYRRVTVRRLYREGHVLESYQTFSKPEYFDSSYFSHNNGYVDKSQYDADDHLLSRERHYFYGSPNDSFNMINYGYISWRSGREYRSDFYDASSNLLRKTETTWEQRDTVGWWTGGSDTAPQNDPRVSQTVSYLENGQSSRTSYSYDPYVPFNSLTDVYNYDYSGALLRHSQTTYLKTLNGVDYSGSNITNGSDPHLRDFPQQVSIYDSGGMERARTTYEYDNYASDTYHAALINRSDISGFDSSFNTSYTTRGNVTATTRSLITNGSATSITSYAQYDIAGNVVKVIDPRSTPTNIIATTFDFTDRFGAPNAEAEGNTAPSELSSVNQSSYAFATKVTNALGQTAYTQFDYYLGTPVDVEDVNGVVSSAYFDDALDRPTKIIHASNQDPAVDATIKSQTTFTYDDTNRIVTTTSDLNSYGDNALKSQALYDGLGRTVESRQYENSTQYTVAKQIPFMTLQDPDSGVWTSVTQSSNPYRPYLSETAAWSTSFSDSLGRMTKVRTPDNAIVRTSYSVNTVIVTDQAGKQSKSVSDALGHLTQVIEDPNGLNFLTNYSYDTLDNLTGVSQYDPVSQYTQTRTFVYDTLKRLASVTNPENGTVSYQYDNSGNLVLKTDPRPLPNSQTHVQTSYAYDALNRVTSRAYNDGTPAVNYFYDAQSLPSTPSGYSRGYSTGRLVAVTYGGGSQGDYYGLDAAGRTRLKYQQTGGVNYRISATYNVAGAITAETYPSNNTVSYGYDSAGRMSSFSGSLGDNTNRNYSTEITYSPFGMAKEKFGTATPIYTKMLYNVRGQLGEIRAGTTYSDATDTSWNRGAIINSYSNQPGSGCWGASCSATDNNGNLQQQDVFIPMVDVPQPSGNGQWTSVSQKFDYDSLNRLQRVYEGNWPNPTWRQDYTYDRFGNRKIDQTYTTASLRNTNYGVDYTTNRLTAPSGTSMSYDAAGNLTYDSTNGSQGDRVYDAENRMTSARGGLSASWQYYTYDGAGQRVRRNVNTVETWQVYGIGGELIAEYVASGSQLTKEYGYRNGQLLITATVASSGWGTPPVIHDNPLKDPNNPESFNIKSLHITELRVAINALRSHLNMSQHSWTTSAQPGDWVTADPILEMQVALDEALGAPSPAYTGGLAHNQPILAVHIQELRNRVLAAWNSGTGGVDVRWLIADQLGTPRIILDQNGSFSGTTRHDYLAFGEELVAGGRNWDHGYTNSDVNRQKFTGYERDDETELDYAHARYHSSAQGRFTGVDPVPGRESDPQSWNGYAYVRNNPVNGTDPTGMNYFMGGGVSDPFIGEFQVDGFSQSPEETSSTIRETQPPANASAQWDEFGNGGAQQEPATSQEPTPPSGPLDVITVTGSAPSTWWDGFVQATGTKDVNWPWLFGEFVSGKGPRARRFDSTSSLTQNLQTSPDVATHRSRFCASGKTTYNSDDYSALWFGSSAKDGPYHAGPLNEGRQFIGSFEMRIKMMTHGWTGYALFVAKNKTSTFSGAYHRVGEVNRPGPFQTITQYFWWIEYNPCNK